VQEKKLKPESKCRKKDNAPVSLSTKTTA